MGPLEPVRELGIILFMSLNNLKILWWVCLWIHIVESGIALALALRVDAENVGPWVLQTMIYGFPSLRLLLAKVPKGSLADK